MKKIIATENAPKAVGPYSQAIEVNGVGFRADSGKSCGRQRPGDY